MRKGKEKKALLNSITWYHMTNISIKIAIKETYSNKRRVT